MELNFIETYSNAQKIILAEKIWDSVEKKDIEISNDVGLELEFRLKKLDEGKSELFSWDEVKNHLKKIRNA